jgi:hypothetical protein
MLKRALIALYCHRCLPMWFVTAMFSTFDLRSA